MEFIPLLLFGYPSVGTPSRSLLQFPCLYTRIHPPNRDDTEPHPANPVFPVHPGSDKSDPDKKPPAKPKIHETYWIYIGIIFTKPSQPY